MNVAVIGRGLIGGSIEKAALRAGHAASVFRGRGPVPDLGAFDLVFVAVPPEAIPALVDAIAEKGNKTAKTVNNIRCITLPIVTPIARCHAYRA